MLQLRLSNNYYQVNLTRALTSHLNLAGVNSEAHQVSIAKRMIDVMAQTRLGQTEWLERLKSVGCRFKSPSGH